MRPRSYGLLRGVFHLLMVILCTAVVLAGFLYGMIAEVELRELRVSDGWYRWQHERALAEYAAERVQ